MGALWLVSLLNGLLGSPFLLYVERNPGECTKLITFGLGLAATFQYEPLAKVQLEGLKGVRHAQNGGLRKGRREL